MHAALLSTPVTHFSLPRYLAQACLLLAVMVIAWSPFSGGARLPTLLLAVIGGGLVLTALPSLSKQLAIRRWTTVFLLLWLPMWISLIHSFSAKATLVAIGWFSLMYLAGIALILVMQQATYRALFARSIAGVMILWILDSVIQYLFGTDLLGVPKSPDGRITGMFSDLHQGILMLPILPLIFYHFQPNRAWLAWGMLLGAGVVIASSGARGYVYIYIFMLLLGLWRRQPGWKAWLIVLSVPLLVATCSSLLNPQLAKYKLANTQAITANDQSLFDRANHALSYRLNLWETGLRMLQSEPLTGIGSNNYKRAYQQFATRADDPFANNPTHTHNIYVECLAETGLVGGVALLAAIVLCVGWFKQADTSSRHQAWPYALPLLVIYFPINTTQPMLVPWWFPILMLLISTFLASLEQQS